MNGRLGGLLESILITVTSTVLVRRFPSVYIASREAE